MTASDSDIAPPAWPASGIVVAIAAAMLATWLPQYLTWPWWPDADAWATMAQGWDAGLRPYRDVTCFNFPGQIYESWLLGRLFGWGRTWPFYALDAALLLGLGPLLAFWSRRHLNAAVAGWLGWSAAIATYCGLNYTLVAQRDWQAPLLAMAALAALQTWPGRIGAIGSAGLMAAAFTIRPHVVLFFMPIGLAIGLAQGWRLAMRRWFLWGCAFGMLAALFFLPLIAQGLLADFIRGVRQASYGSGYGKTTPSTIGLGVLRQIGLAAPPEATKPEERFWLYLAGWKVLATLAGLAAMVAFSRPERRRLALPWLAALATAILYAPLHPKSHTYLVLPLKLVWSIAWGLLAGLVLERIASSRKALRVGVFVGFLAVAVPGVPTYCLPGEAMDAILGRRQNAIPAAAQRLFAPGYPASPYRWDDYQSTLRYLRERTGRDTRVAAILRNIPFPAINGVVGRVSPLPAESGIIWLWSVNPKLEPAFAQALDACSAGSVVVWSPDEEPFTADLRLPQLCAAIRRGFRPEARFGAFQVWRKA